MRKSYPYLQDSYYEDANSQRQRRDFLSTIDNFVSQKVYVKITLLNWEEEPLKEIEGELTSGTITKDGSSSVRRACQLGATVSRGEYTVENTEMDFSINKKVFIEIGLKNYSDQYREYPILWFPQGVFFISTFSISSSSSSSINISLSLKDKMCGLNGEVGGTFQSTVILDEMQTQSPTGQTLYEKVLLYDLIQELVNHWGGEDLNNIVIEDVPLRIRRVMKWTGDTPLCMRESGDSEDERQWQCYPLNAIPKDEQDLDWQQFNNGEDVGYVYDDFYYTSELTATAGETVTSVLDKIVQYLGNYEYFYDEFGVFHFREIKNYLNTTQATDLLEDMNANNYLVDIATDKDVYSFSDNTNLISINASPQYNNIKNDYVIHGVQQMTSSDISYDIFYHLVIDNKPQPLGSTNSGVYYNTYHDLLLYKDEDTDLTLAAFPVYVEELPEVGNFNVVYRSPDTTKGELEDSIGGYQNEQKDASSRIEELKEKEQVLSDQLAIVESKLEKYRAVSEAAKDELDETDKLLDETLETIKNNHSNLKNHQNELTSIKENLVSYKKQYAELEDIIAENPDDQESKDKLNLISSYLVVLKEESSKKQVEIDELKNQIEDQTKKVEEYENKIKELEEVINKITLPGTVGDNFNTVNTLDGGEEDPDTDGEEGSAEEFLALIREERDLKDQLEAVRQEIHRNEKAINDLDNKINEAQEEITENEDNQNVTLGYAFYIWEDTIYKKLPVIKYYSSDENESGYTVLDWRTEIYMQGMLAKNSGTDAGMYYHNLELDYTQAANDQGWISNILRYGRKNRIDTDYYFQELEAFWPQIYNLETQMFYGQESGDALESTTLTDGVYYLDFIEPQTSGLGEFSVQNIGRRMDVVNDDKINCLFQPAIPDVVFLNYDEEDEERKQELLDECLTKGEQWTQVSGDVYYALATGGWRNAAFDQIKYELYLHTNYQKTLAISALPAYYLEPNSRVTINDKSTNTYGSFILTSLSIPLGSGNAMSGSCSECLERF